jgi:hypothetical protein
MSELTLEVIQIQIFEPNSNPSETARLTRDLVESLGKQRDIEAALNEGRAELGSKGEVVLAGQIAMQLIASGGVVVTLVNVFKSYFERKPLLEVEIKRKDGETLKVRAESVEDKQLSSFLEKIREFLQVPAVPPTV